ncbi:MAG: hypothetical protein U9N01_04375 [Euryarchaeota archaeon]|nr:hypothetical protein [Euryarchaeota archaeon]
MREEEDKSGAALSTAEERENAWLDSENDRILKEIQAIVREG